MIALPGLDAWLTREPTSACDEQEDECERVNDDADECACQDRLDDWREALAAEHGDRMRDERAERDDWYDKYGDD